MLINHPVHGNMLDNATIRRNTLDKTILLHTFCISDINLLLSYLKH